MVIWELRKKRTQNKKPQRSHIRRARKQVGSQERDERLQRQVMELQLEILQKELVDNYESERLNKMIAERKNHKQFIS